MERRKTLLNLIDEGLWEALRRPLTGISVRLSQADYDIFTQELLGLADGGKSIVIREDNQSGIIHGFRYNCPPGLTQSHICGLHRASEIIVPLQKRIHANPASHPPRDAI